MLRISFSVPTADAEIARARLLALAPTGFEERELGDMTELAVYAEEVDAHMLRSALSDPVSVERVESGWETRWREFHRPVRAGGLWIGPPWETVPADEPTVIVDPGRAFGTGAHPTTRACIELLAARERGSLLDAGTGSGVIAVAAARLGFEPIFALDVDREAVEAATATASRNGVRVQIWQADVLIDDLPPADLVIANIELRSVEALLARRPAACAITSGYLAHELPRAPGWQPSARLGLGGWAGDVFTAS